MKKFLIVVSALFAAAVSFLLLGCNSSGGNGKKTPDASAAYYRNNWMANGEVLAIAVSEDIVYIGGDLSRLMHLQVFLLTEESGYANH